MLIGYVVRAANKMTELVEGQVPSCCSCKGPLGCLPVAMEVYSIAAVPLANDRGQDGCRHVSLA